MLGGLSLCWLGLLPLGALAVLDTNLGNQTIERVSVCSWLGVHDEWLEWRVLGGGQGVAVARRVCSSLGSMHAVRWAGGEEGTSEIQREWQIWASVACADSVDDLRFLPMLSSLSNGLGQF